MYTQKNMAILTYTPHRPPLLGFGPPPPEIDFFDVLDDLEQKKKIFFFGTKIFFFGLRKFFEKKKKFFCQFFFSGSIMNANLTLYLPPSCSNLTA